MNQGFIRIVAALAMMVAMVVVGMPQGVVQAQPAMPQTPVMPAEVTTNFAVPAIPELMQTDPITGTACTADIDCAVGELCNVSGFCVAADGAGGYCAADSDCLSGQACDSINGVCVDPTTASAPFIDSASVAGAAFAGGCYYTGNWVGQYWGSWYGPSGDFFRDDLIETPLPYVEELLTAPPAADIGGGIFGVTYNYQEGYITDNDGRYLLAQNPVMMTCDDNLSYNFGVGKSEGAPTNFFGVPNIYDRNNVNILTGQRRMYLSGDYWSGEWTSRWYFDPDFPEGGDEGRCKTTKFANPRGPGTITICLPGLYLIRMDVNDGGQWFLDGGIPDTDALYTIFLESEQIDAGWYSAFQDRKETVRIGFVLNSWIYASEYLAGFYDGLWGVSGDTAALRLYDSGFVSNILMEYYQKDGPAVVSLRVFDFEDTGVSLADAELAGAHDIWDGAVLPPDWYEAYEKMKDQVPSEPTDQEPGVTPLTPEQIVARVYLPVISQ